MTARLYIDDIGGTYTEITGRLSREGWEVSEQAEEGSGGMSTVAFDDPGMDWDVVPWTRWYIVEDTSEDANSVLVGGWVTEQEIGRESGGKENPLGRVWSVSLNDANTYWQMRVMVGSDANRPAETDVERMQWLLATNEMAWALDVTTYVQTTTPVAMDACDYRGQYVNQIVDDCAQASGRNWYTWIDIIATVRTVTVWYGHDDWAVRDSALSLSNDPDDWTDAELADDTSLVWPISYDTKLGRDPSRMYDGVYVQYAGGAVYRDLDPRTVRRDFISPSSNVKSAAKAIARATRYLAELKKQDEVITTSVELPAAKGTMIRAGMRVQFKASHLPKFEAFRWCRVLSCSVTPVAAGERYRLTLELSPGEYIPVGMGFLAGMEGGWPNNSFWSASFLADGVEVLSSSQLAASSGYLIPFPDGPVAAHTWQLRLTVNWTTVYMPPSHFLYALCITPDGTDLFGNGWTPGGDTIASRTSVSYQQFVASGPADGFSLYGWLNDVEVEQSYGTLTLDQSAVNNDPTNAWGVNQTDIINNTVRTLVYTWTWTV